MPQPLARRSARVALLLAVMGLGASLRFAGLAYEVRHPQHLDERVFVNNVIEMLAARDLDHRYYEYPGLYYYLLALPVAMSQPERIDDPRAVLAARGLVATFGVASIALIYLLGSRLGHPGVGLAAALFLAVSPNEVAGPHAARPDVVLQTVTIAAYFGLLGLGPERRGDIRAALGIGAATAVKFTGFLLFPSYVVTRLRAPGPRFGRILATAVIAALVVLAATPYALLHPQAYAAGVSHQMGAHYHSTLSLATYATNLAKYGRWVVEALGIPLIAASLVGVAISLRSAQTGLLGLFIHLPVTVLVMATAGLGHPRFLIPASGAIFLAAGLGVRALSRRRPLAALALTLVAAAIPFCQSQALVRPLLRTSPRDGALDWIESNLASGARILETREEALSERRAQLIGADPRRFEILFHFPGERGLQLLASQMDLVIVGAGPGTRWAEFLPVVYQGRRGGQVVFELRKPRCEDRHRYASLGVGTVRAEASTGRAGAAALVDGDPKTVWTSSRPMRVGDWIEMSWDTPQPLARIELSIAARPTQEPTLEILTSDEDGNFRRRTAISARETVDQQVAAGRPVSQVFLLQPEPARAVRIRVANGARESWSLGEVELSVRESAGGPASVGVETSCGSASQLRLRPDTHQGTEASREGAKGEGSS